MPSRIAMRAAAVVLLGLANGAHAEPAALGEAFRLNPDIPPPPYQGGASIARAPGGGFAAAWLQWDTSTAGLRLFARAYTAGGQPRSAALPVNQRDVQLTGMASAGASSGQFVVAWGYRSGEPPAYVSEGLYARRFGADAQPLGAEFEVAPQASTTASMAAAMAPNGRFVVLWFGTGETPQLNGIYGRLYEADGTPRTGPLRLVELDGHFGQPQVLIRDDGSIVLAYTCANERGECEGSTEPLRTMLRGFDADGAPTFGPVDLGTYANLSGLDPLPDGGFQLVWSQSGATPYYEWDVLGRRFGADGVPAAPAFKANVEYTSPLAASGVDAAGATTLIWLDEGYGSLSARSFDRWAQPDGGAFAVGEAIVADPPSVSFDAAGGFLLVWVCPVGNDATLCARFYGEPAEGPPPPPPPVKAEPPAGIGNNEVGSAVGAFGAAALLPLLLGVALRRRRRG